MHYLFLSGGTAKVWSQFCGALTWKFKKHWYKILSLNETISVAIIFDLDFHDMFFEFKLLSWRLLKLIAASRAVGTNFLGYITNVYRLIIVQKSFRYFREVALSSGLALLWCLDGTMPCISFSEWPLLELAMPFFLSGISFIAAVVVVLF